MGDVSDEDNALPFLSDDEDLDEHSHEILEPLRRGALPPEIKVLFGLALIGEGGKKFLAAKCSEALDDLKQEDKEWLSEGLLETDLAEDPSWPLFRRAMTETLERTGAYAFVADVLRKTGKEQEWSGVFLPRFRRHLDAMKKVGLTDNLLVLRSEESSAFRNFRKNQVMKIILAACRFMVHEAESSVNSNKQPGQAGKSADCGLNLALSSIKSLTDVMHLLWKVDTDGSLAITSVEVRLLPSTV